MARKKACRKLMRASRERPLHAMVRAIHSFTSSLVHFFTHSLQPNDSKYFGFNQPGIKKIGRVPSLIPIKTRTCPRSTGEWGGCDPVM